MKSKQSRLEAKAKRAKARAAKPRTPIVSAVGATRSLTSEQALHEFERLAMMPGAIVEFWPGWKRDR